jgi:hypothetical protein
LSTEAPNAAEKIERLMRENPWAIPAHPPKVQDLGDGVFEITSIAPDEEIKEKQQRFMMEMGV